MVLCDLNRLIGRISLVLNTLDFEEFEALVPGYYFNIRKYALAVSCLYGAYVAPPTLRRLTDEVPHWLNCCLRIGISYSNLFN
jgi:hypothetical protein